MTFCLLQIALFEPNVKTFSHHYLSVSHGAWNKGRWANNLQGHFLRHGNITPSCHIWLRLTNLYLSPNKNKKKNVSALTLNHHVVWNPDTQIKQKVYKEMRCPQFLLTTQKLPEVNVFMYMSLNARPQPLLLHTLFLI